MGFISKIKGKLHSQKQIAKGKLAAIAEAAMRYYRLLNEKIIYAREIAFSEKHNNYFAAVAFFPFIGWLIPLYLKPENEFCQKQAKRGFYLAFVFLTTIALLLFIGIFFSRDWRVVRFIHAIVIYLVELTYFAFCAYGARMSVLNREAEIIDKFPFVSQLATIIEL